MTKATWPLVVLCAAGVAGLQGQTPLPKGTNSVLGRVLDMGTDGPVAGAIVTLTGHFDASGKPLARIPPDPVPGAPAGRNVFTTSEGYFVFRDLPAGRYSVGTRAFGYMNFDFPPTVVEIAERDTPLPVELHLWKYAAVSGRVVDERGEPVVGMPVTALRRVVTAGNLSLEPEGAAVPTDDRGAYRIAHLPPGSYVVGVRSTSFSVPATLAAAIDAAASNREASFALTSAMINGGSIIRTGEGNRVGDVVLQRQGPQLPLSPEGAPLGYSTTLHPGTTSPAQATVITLGSGESRDAVDIPMVFSKTVSVSGVVTRPDGPAKNLTVRLVPSGADSFDYEGSGAENAVTDGAGAFTFAAVMRGDYVLRTSASSGNMEAGEAVFFWAMQPVTVGERAIAGLEVTMRPGATVSGELRFTGAPPPVVSYRLPVILEPMGTGMRRLMSALVKPDMTFTSVGGSPGRYLLTLFWNVYEPLGWSFLSATLGGKPVIDDVIELGTADISSLVITLAPAAARVTGSITDSTSRSAAGTDVIAFPADSALWREGIFNRRRVLRVRATTAKTFEMTRLGPGDYYIAAVSSKWTARWEDPAFLERLIPGATRFTLAGSESKTLQLTTILPRER